MNYDWEDKATREHFAQLAGILPYPLWVIGLAVVNEETGEAALIPNPRTFPEKGRAGMEDADAWSDICGDAHRLYSQTLDDVFGPFREGKK